VTLNDEAQIRQVIDLRTFDIAPPLQSKKADARAGLAAWFRSWSGPIGYEVHDLSIEVGGDVAFSASLNWLSGSRTNGEHTDVWIRVTVGFRKTGGKWLVRHEHVSVPSTWMAA
jgi:ketosteroid isomerase-like protein